MKLYHASPNKFDAFKTMHWGPSATKDVGHHFGTKQTAVNRIKQLVNSDRSGYEQGNPLYLYEADVDISNPLRLGEKLQIRPGGGSWAPHRLAELVIEDAPGVSADMAESFYDGTLEMGGVKKYDAEDDDAQYHSWVKSLIRSLGFDGIVYNNAYEGGGDSFMALDPGQITITDVKEIYPEEVGIAQPNLEKEANANISEEDREFYADLCVEQLNAWVNQYGQEAEMHSDEWSDNKLHNGMENITNNFFTYIDGMRDVDVKNKLLTKYYEVLNTNHGYNITALSSPKTPFLKDLIKLAENIDILGDADTASHIDKIISTLIKPTN